jgi:chromosome partitioning protein
MAVVIAVANQKGGAGKTTTSINLAAGLSDMDYRVLLIDADDQASALNWRNNGGEENRLGFTIVGMPSSSLHKDVPALAKDYDVVVIDCPPGGLSKGNHKDNITRSAILASNVVLMPVQPSPVDYQAASYMLPLVQEVSMVRPDLRLLVLTNRRPVGNVRLGRFARTTAQEFFQLDGVSVTVLETEISHRVAFAESAGAGQSVLAYQKDSKAAEEVRRLTEEVIACLTVHSAA